MADRLRPYLFYDVAVSICSTCFRKIEAKIVFEDGNVFMLKRCPSHGFERVLIADDVDYYKLCREVFLKPPEMPNRFNTPIKWGCPYDCGLCPDHEQHSCLTRDIVLRGQYEVDVLGLHAGLDRGARGNRRRRL